jgi:hypothetical protein
LVQVLVGAVTLGQVSVGVSLDFDPRVCAKLVFALGLKQGRSSSLLSRNHRISRSFCRTLDSTEASGTEGLLATNTGLQGLLWPSMEPNHTQTQHIDDN